MNLQIQKNSFGQKIQKNMTSTLRKMSKICDFGYFSKGGGHVFLGKNTKINDFGHFSEMYFLNFGHFSENAEVK